MCNLYNVTTTRDAVLQFAKAFRDLAGWNEASFDVYPATRLTLSASPRTVKEKSSVLHGACLRLRPM